VRAGPANFELRTHSCDLRTNRCELRAADCFEVA